MSLEDEIKYQTLIETSPDAIFLIEMDSGEILEVNEQVEDLLGYDRSELIGQQVELLHPTEDLDRYVSKFQEAVDRESVQFSKFEDGTQVYLVDSDGNRIPVDINATVAEAERGTVMFGVARDITNLKAYEDDLTRLAGELAVVNRLVRHDIRNDMTVVLGRIEQLQSELDETESETLSLLRRRIESVVELTDNVKDYVDMLDSDADITLEHVDLRAVIEQEAVAVRQSYDDLSLSVGDIPTEPVLANSMVASIFRNLFHNAVQHNDKAVPEVEVTTEQTPETIVVHVADNGPGISDDRKENIFGKEDKGLDSSGTGIGLYLIGELTDRFDGAVRVRDNDPEGTIFSVELQKA